MIVPGVISIAAAMPGIGNVHVIIAADGARWAEVGDMLHIAVDQHARTLMLYGTPNETSAAPRLWDGADER